MEGKIPFSSPADFPNIYFKKFIEEMVRLPRLSIPMLHISFIELSSFKLKNILYALFYFMKHLGWNYAFYTHFSIRDSSALAVSFKNKFEVGGRRK